MQHKSKAKRIFHRRKERDDQMKATTGYKVWNVAFTIMYPFVAVFAALFAVIVAVFSRISQAFAWLLSSGKTR